MILLVSLLVGLSVWLVTLGALRARRGAAPPPGRWAWRRRLTWTDRLRARLVEAGVVEAPWLTPGRFLLLAGAAGAVAAWLASLLSGLWLLGLVFAGIGVYGAFGAVEAVAARRERRRDADMAGVIGQIGAIIDQVGADVEALLLQLARTGPESLRAAFAEAATTARQHGLPAGMAALNRRLGPRADDVCEMLALADEQGFGEIPALLMHVAAIQRRALRRREQVITLQRTALLEANLLTAGPFVLLVLTRSLAPADFAEWETPAGALGLAAILALVLAGRVALRLVGEVRVIRRVRRPT